MIASLKPEQLRRTYQAEDLDFDFDRLPPRPKAIIGQQRALKALQFGLGNRSLGFNIYVSCPSAEGKVDAVKHFLEDLAAGDPRPCDWAYVNNFDSPYQPNALRLPPGKAVEFKKDMEEFIREAREALVKAFESEEYQQKQAEINRSIKQKQQELFNELGQKAKGENIMIKKTPIEILAVPVVDGAPMTEEQYHKLTPEEKEQISRKREEFQESLNKTIRNSIRLEKDFNRLLRELEEKVALFAIDNLLIELKEKYEKDEEIPGFLEDVKNDIIVNMEAFLKELPGGDRYEVNVLVDNTHLSGAPITVELNPTYYNLFGSIERESQMGILITNFTLIREGALHRANGGYLILPVQELLMNPFSWESLKRALRNRQIEIENPSDKYGFITTKSLKPEAIPLDVQVILIGSSRLYYLLYELDDEFRHLFKVKSDFDLSMPADRKNLEDFGLLIRHLSREESLLPINRPALAKIIEYGHRLAERQDRIYIQTEDIADVVREAHFYAREEGLKEIAPEQIVRTIEEKQYRSNLLQEKIMEMMEKGVLVIDVDGEKTAQVNGLSVLDLGDITFGRPNRITAAISVGHHGVIDIEKEAELGGPIHTKGVLILSGFLFDTFGRDKPLNLSVQLVFEQSYGGIEGDSASAAELFAILSGLAGLPVKQGIAVTGSVNQRGEIQAIGGVNEKIEGFFEVCKQRGLNGNQGVIIPASNRLNLMLREDVVEAVAKGQFHIWAIDTVREGIEVLTGVKAGDSRYDEKKKELVFEADTVFHRVDQKLREMNEILQAFSKKGDE